MNKVHKQDFKMCSELFEKAFSNDPLLIYLFGKNPNRPINKFFHFILEYANVKNQLIVGKELNGVIQGVACIETPDSQQPLKSISTHFKSMKILTQFALQIEWSTFKKINHYMKITSALRPKRPYHYLVCIGVHPKEQGKGIGKHLLELIHKTVDADPISTGIGLDTENKDNVELYKKFGYQLVSEDKLGDITIYSMFRSKGNDTP